MRLTDREKQEIITEYATGKSKSAIARKFNCSVPAVSKILTKFKDNESLTKLKDSLNNEESSVIRGKIIRKATESLYFKDYDSMQPEVLLKIIERLSLLDKELETTETNELKLIIEKKVVDLSDGNDTL